MISEMATLFSNLIGSLAVVIVVAGILGGSDVLDKMNVRHKEGRSAVTVGLIGGLFGIYGNLSGVDVMGALITIRDVGPMLSGILGGPLAGLIAGAIAGLHRLTFGGITAQACIVATCLIGLFSGCLSGVFNEKIMKPVWSFAVGAVMETMHLGIVLIMVKPFSTALAIVEQIAVPFVLINATGLMIINFLIQYIDRQKKNEIERNRLSTELETASIIQHSLLPPINERYPGRVEIAICASMEAAKEVGGDFYDLFHVGEDSLAFVMADVSGKGIPAALVMANAKQTIQGCVRDIPDLAEAIETANNSLCEHNEAEMFVTAWIGILDLATGVLRYVNAGHNPPAIISHTYAEYIRTKPNFVLAGFEDMKYNVQSIEMKRGDKLFLYTDGVTEAENAQHELFGEERLLQCLTGAVSEESAEVLEHVRKDVEKHVSGAAQFDDMTMMCVEYRGA